MRLALVLGGGDTLHRDISKFRELGIPYHGVFACNDAGAEWPEELAGWVTLHPEKYFKWVAKRESNGHAPALSLWAHRQPASHISPEVRVTKIEFPRQRTTGSSGLFAAKVAMVDCGFDRVVFCGVPMTPTPHFFDDTAWRAVEGFWRQWHMVEKSYLDRMRSMSGRTRVMLGGPDDWQAAVCEGSGVEGGSGESDP